jgi:acyl-CoA reductase-like NAD-dependent aldehyde dehydrogenase
MCGGNQVGEDGYYMEPTVFAGCEDHMSVFNEEVRR